MRICALVGRSEINVLISRGVFTNVSCLHQGWRSGADILALSESRTAISKTFVSNSEVWLTAQKPSSWRPGRSPPSQSLVYRAKNGALGAEVVRREQDGHLLS